MLPMVMRDELSITGLNSLDKLVINLSGLEDESLALSYLFVEDVGDCC